MSLKKVILLKVIWLIFAGLGVLNKTAIATTDHVYTEVVLKKIAQRIEKMLSESLEAQVFIEEDLNQAVKVIKNAQIKWQNSYSQFPTIFQNGANRSLRLSKYLSMKSTSNEQIIITLEILFHIKRQLEGSTLQIPKVRIKLFAQKFSPILLSETDSCSTSTFPLPSSLPLAQRDEFQLELISLLESRGHSYDSTWGTNIIWIDAKERTDGECNGNNRNIFELSMKLINIKEQTGEIIAQAVGTSCGYSESHKEQALKKLIKEIKSALPKCNSAFRDN